MIWVLLMVGGFWSTLLLLVLWGSGVTLRGLLWGEWEPLPDDMGAWRVESAPDGAEVLSEERWLRDGREGWLVRQRRERNRTTGDVVRVLPEVRVRRRRLRR